MPRLSWQRSLLPLTISVMLVAFTEKAGSLAKAATGAADQPAASAQQMGSAATAGNRPAQVKPATTFEQAAEEASQFADLKRRREALDRRAAALEQRAELVEAAEQKLQAKLDQLGALQARLEQADQQRRQRVAANWGGLVKTYEAMKPDEAAAIFNGLDTDVLLEVLDRMDDRKEAQVLAAMLPERARQVTQMLAHKRLQEDSDGGAEPEAQHG